MKYVAPHFKNKFKAGFTLVELMVSMAIMVLVMALVLVNYGKFDTGIILTNLGYDVGLSIRKAQTYGLSVKGVAESGVQNFTYSYGIHFDTSKPKDYTLFVDVNKDFLYTSSLSTEKVEQFHLGGSYEVAGLYTLSGTTKNSVSSIDVTFTRPNPDATMYADGAKTTLPVEIDLRSSDDTSSIKSIIVRATGQISIQ